MKLPLAVQQQVEEADRLQEELTGKPEPEEAEKPPEAEPEEPIEDVTPPVAPSEEVTPPPEESAGHWKQKYNTLQGMFKAEVKKESENFNAELERQNRVISSLNDIVVTLQKERNKAPEAEDGKTPDTKTSKAKTKLDEKEFIDNFGEEIGPLVEMVNSLRDENQRLTVQLGSVGQTVQQSNQDRFFGDLTNAAPNWQALNYDEGFNSFLDTPVEASELETGDTFGENRRKLLEQAFYSKNAKKVARFFNLYKPSTVIPKGKSINLEDQALPEPAGGGGEPIKAGPTVTVDQLAKAGTDYAKGKITEDQYNKIADAYQKALTAGGR